MEESIRMLEKAMTGNPPILESAQEWTDDKIIYKIEYDGCWYLYKDAIGGGDPYDWECVCDIPDRLAVPFWICAWESEIKRLRTIALANHYEVSSNIDDIEYARAAIAEWLAVGDEIRKEGDGVNSNL